MGNRWHNPAISSDFYYPNHSQMNQLLALIFILISSSAFAQIADSSFFSSVHSLNPGVAHNREQGLISLDASQQNVKKNHAVTAGGVVGGIETDVGVQKNDLFYASKGGIIAFEALGNMETGKSVEHIDSTTYGSRNVENKASSHYFGGIIDFTIFGFSYSAANYYTNYQFRVGTPPDVSAHDTKTNIDYTFLKLGTAFNIKGFTFGAFGMSRTTKESYDYTFYDPTTGNQGTTENYPATSSATGFGVGIGYTSKTFRVEISTEQLAKPSVKYDTDPQEVINKPPASSRTGIAVEARFGKLSLGASIKNNVGNYTDLDDLITSNLIYGQLSASDSRLETAFNFGYGADKGLSFSAFYSQSSNNTNEESTIFPNGVSYPATTKSSSYGASVTYYF